MAWSKSLIIALFVALSAVSQFRIFTHTRCAAPATLSSSQVDNTCQSICMRSQHVLKGSDLTMLNSIDEVYLKNVKTKTLNFKRHALARTPSYFMHTLCLCSALQQQKIPKTKAYGGCDWNCLRSLWSLYTGWRKMKLNMTTLFRSLVRR